MHSTANALIELPTERQKPAGMPAGSGTHSVT